MKPPRSYLTKFPTNRLIADLVEKNSIARLTTGTSTSTLVQVEADVDATTRALLERLEALGEMQAKINRERDAIMTALAIAGVRPPGKIESLPSTREATYQVKHSFADKSIRDACAIILKDHKGEWLSKAQIEYLVVRGGYKFETSDTMNSVGITLQRMADEGMCEVQRARGQHGNRYRWPLDENKS